MASTSGFECKENYFHPKTQLNESLKHYKPKSSSTHTNSHAQFVVEMFVEICKRLDKASQDYLRKVIPIDEGKDSLAQTDLLIILNYFKQIAIYLIKTKLELEDRLAATEQSSQYESMIQKLEAEIRQHIRVEQQLRLYAETAQQKMDDLQSDKTQLGEQVKELNLQLATKIKELQQTQAQLSRQSLTRNSNRSNKLITEPMYAETDQREFTHIYTENSENSKQLTQLQIQAALKKHTFQRDVSKPNGDRSPTVGDYHRHISKSNNNLPLQQTQLNSLISSPEKVQRKYSQATAETRAIKQPTFNRQTQNIPLQPRNTLGYLRSEMLHQLSYRSNSQEPLQTHKKSKY